MAGTGMSSMTPDQYTVGIVHNHVLGAFPNPSAHDIYTAGSTNAFHPNATFSLVSSPTAHYAVVVSSPTDFATFLLSILSQTSLIAMGILI